jgi:hypothetical protein
MKYTELGGGGGLGPHDIVEGNIGHGWETGRTLGQNEGLECGGEVIVSRGVGGRPDVQLSGPQPA